MTITRAVNSVPFLVVVLELVRTILRKGGVFRAGFHPGQPVRSDREQGRETLAALVEHNLPFVVRMAGRYWWSGVPVIDLFQEGVLGLLRAAERFDWTLGTPFGAYASWWVRHAMSRAVSDAAHRLL